MNALFSLMSPVSWPVYSWGKNAGAKFGEHSLIYFSDAATNKPTNSAQSVQASLNVFRAPSLIHENVATRKFKRTLF